MRTWIRPLPPMSLERFRFLCAPIRECAFSSVTHCHPEPCSCTPQSNTGFAGTPVWAKDLAGCFGRNCWWRLFGQAPLAFGPKSLTSSISVGNIAGDPSPKSRAQDDRVLKFGNTIHMDESESTSGLVPAAESPCRSYFNPTNPFASFTSFAGS